MLSRNRIICLLLLGVGAFVLAGKAYSFPWNYDMWLQPSILPYEEPVIYPGLSVSTTGQRIEPLPREDFEDITTNPVEATQESLAQGEQLYNTFCYVCHGMEGKGDGPVIKRGFYPLDLTSPAVVARTEGYIYAYIRYGGKVMMPSYRESITEQGAWDVVNYVRKLQGNTATTPQNSIEENTEQDGSEN